MTCEARRQGDELYCHRCNLRWGQDEPVPDACVKKVRDETLHADTPTFPTHEPRSDVQTIIAGGIMAFNGEHDVTPDQARVVLMAMHFAADPGASKGIIKTSCDKVCEAFPRLTALRKKG